MANILKDSYDEHFALIIGINEYENLPNLEYAVNDAKAVKDVLINKFKYKEDNIKMLIDKEAIYQNIMDNFFDLVKDTAINDSVIIFFVPGKPIPYLCILQRLRGLLIWQLISLLP